MLVAVLNWNKYGLIQMLRKATSFLEKKSVIQSMLQNNSVMWRWSQETFWERIINVIWSQCLIRVPLQLKLLHESSKKYVEFFFSQSLSQTDAFPNSKRNDSLMRHKMSFIIKEPFRIKFVRVWKMFWVVHDMVQASKDGCVFRYDVISQGYVLCWVVRDSGANQSSCTQTFEKNSICVMKLWSVFKAWESVMSNNLLNILTCIILHREQTYNDTNAMSHKFFYQSPWATFGYVFKFPILPFNW